MQVMLVFVCLSVVETFALSLLFNSLINPNGIKSIWVVTNYRAGCKILYWIAGFCQMCSSWYVLLFSMERFISVRFPLKRAVIWTRKRTRMAVVAITVTMAVLETYLLYFYDLRNRGKCVFLFSDYGFIKQSTTEREKVRYTFNRPWLLASFVGGQFGHCQQRICSGIAVKLFASSSIRRLTAGSLTIALIKICT
jgi:hypothetical protein